MSEFKKGQRWVSNTEAELGLGVVSDVAGRRVIVDFPATEEQRTYATSNAPISRVEYAEGDQVSSDQGVNGEVVQRHDNQGLFIYLVKDEAGEEHFIPESNLASNVKFVRPLDRLLSGQVDRGKRFRMRIETAEQMSRLVKSPTAGLLGPRVQVLPHQLYVAHRVGQRFAPRVLLADEVGLGKTIEAGLIINQQLQSGRASRILVTVPDSLLYQWLIEMLRRFNLKFTILDSMRHATLEMSGYDNPFESAQLVLCAQSFLRDDPEAHANAIKAGWDLMVVDEAHHLEWTPEAPSELYTSIETLAENIPGLLLLSATPEQLGQEGHFARLRLLDPQRYSDLETFKAQSDDYLQVSEWVQPLAEGDVDTLMAKLADDAAYQTGLEQALGADDWKALSEGLQGENPLNAINEALDVLLDRHGTGRVLFRNTRAGVADFPKRVLHPYALDENVEALIDRDKAADAEKEVAIRLRPEEAYGSAWLSKDPRMSWLENWLDNHKDEKALLICQSKDTAVALENHIRLRWGARSAAFHEGMTLIKRDRAAAYFAEQEEGAQILICSEIGSEGRNFQFARHLIMFDLPFSPDLVEQRIGRLDRIGQKHDVNVHVPFVKGSATEGLLSWYDEALALFEEPNPAAAAIFQAQKAELVGALLRSKGDVMRLTGEAQATSQAKKAEMDAGRNRLLELNACHPRLAPMVVEEVLQMENRHGLMEYMDQVFGQFGVDVQPHGPHSIVLHPSDEMLEQEFPELPEEGMTATYHRLEALSREDMHFLTWEHPMVTGVMDLISNGEYGNTNVMSLKLPPLEPGTLMLEMFFKVTCPAPKAMQIGRYFEAPHVRVLVDSEKRNLSEMIGYKHLNQLGNSLRKGMAQSLVREARTIIQTLAEQGEAAAAPKLAEHIEAAHHAVDTLQGAEVSRLKALALQNPNIRDEEIRQAEAHVDQLHEYLDGASLALDAVRLAIVVAD
ncbi:MAG: RNA polymerase-associated protein RapA [Pontibacterium sp.]